METKTINKNTLVFKKIVIEDSNQQLLTDRVEDIIREVILSYPDSEGIKLPQERTLSENLGVSRKTVRKAIESLNNQGFLKSVWGKGTFISAPQENKNNVCLLTSDSTKPFSMMSIGIACERLNELNYSNSLIVSKDPVSSPKLLPDSKDTLGVIIFPGLYTRDYLSKLLGHIETNKICIGDTSDGIRKPLDCNMVVPDNFLITYAATRHLIHLGHKRIAIIVDRFGMVWDNEFINGYKTALETHGIDFDMELVVPFRGVITKATDDNNRFDDLTNQWKQSNNFPTAILCCHTSEVFVDRFRLNFKDEMDLTQIIPVSYSENLSSEYQSCKSEFAIALDFTDVINRGIDNLLNKNSDQHGIIDISGKIHIWKNENNVWVKKELLASS